MIPLGILAAVPHGSTPASGWNAAVAALPNLWGWWKLDETASNGVTAADSSGNGRNGTYKGSGTRAAGLFSGSTYSQSSLSAGIALPNFTTQATPKFTVGCVIKTTNSGSGEQQFFSGDGGSGSRVFQFKNVSGVAVLVTITPSVTVTSGSAIINDGSPHLVIAVFDQSLSAADGRVKIYVDGSLDVKSTTSITITSSLVANLGIACRNGTYSTTGLFSGSVDEAFFCDGALSASDISTIWAARSES